MHASTLVHTYASTLVHTHARGITANPGPGGFLENKLSVRATLSL
jgi:hypothetical protein